MSLSSLSAPAAAAHLGSHASCSDRPSLQRSALAGEIGLKRTREIRAGEALIRRFWAFIGRHQRRVA